MNHPSLITFTLPLLVSVALGGCGDDSTPMRDAGPPVDSATPDAQRPDAGPPCMEDAECDDGVECTRDICDDRGACRNPVDPARCDDGVFCNGLEQCSPLEGGCIAGLPETCNDDDVCTIDRCDEEAKTCRRSPRDFDEDGEADFFCEGGTDCDDRDPTRASGVNEVCDDDVDNDCDMDVDEAECGRPAHDICEDALDVSEGGFFEVTSEGAVADYNLGCAPAGRKDLVLTFTSEERRDVLIRAEGRSRTYLALRTECADRGSEVECEDGFPGEIRVRALEAGTYFVLLGDVGGPVEIEVLFGDPSPPPTNETCEMPLDVSVGGTFEGSFLDVADDLETTCGTSRAPDLTYTFATTEERDVLLSAASESGDAIALELRRACDGEATRCIRGAPAGGRLHRLPAGTYFLVMEGSASREFDFTLDVSFADPTDPPEGDVCGNAVALAPDSSETGTLADKQDDVPLSCGFFYRDAVYQFTLEERSDVTLRADAGGPFLYLGVRETCADDASEIRCVSGNPARTRLRDLAPGTYFVVVESFAGTGFELSLEVNDPSEVQAVSGNDTCESAHPVPASGGRFSGDTTDQVPNYSTRSCGSMATSPDAVYELTLTETRRVQATLEGFPSAYDTVLHLHSGECRDGMETACDDDSGDGSSSLIDGDLSAGTHYFVVDGFGASNAGEYLFEIEVRDP